MASHEQDGTLANDDGSSEEQTPSPQPARRGGSLMETMALDDDVEDQADEHTRQVDNDEGDDDAAETADAPPIHTGAAVAHIENDHEEAYTSFNRAGVTTPPTLFTQDSAKPWYLFGRGAVDPAGSPSGSPVWESDSARVCCAQCQSKFDWLNRRHHCRMDGKLYCKRCCGTFLLLPAHFGVREPQRVCDSCAVELAPMQDELAATISNATRRNAPADAAATDAATTQASSMGGLLPSSPVSFSMSAEIRKACAAVDSFFAAAPQSLLRDQYIPSMLLQQAKGVAFLTVVKVGFVVTTRFGTGIVIGRDRQDSWTAPSAIGLAGVGWGAQMGGEVTDFVIILNTESAVDAFSGRSQVALGSQLSLAAGPLGRTGEASLNVSVGDGRFAPSYTYSQSKGLFMGISLEGAVIRERPDVNERFYGRVHDPKDILAGRVPRPNAAAPLYAALQRAGQGAHSASVPPAPSSESIDL